MTQVRIDTLNPRAEEAQADLLRLLQQQPGRDAGWPQRLQAEIRAQAPATFDAFLRAAADGSILAAALVLTRREPGEQQDRPWLAALWVDPEVRGGGLGHKMLEVAESASRERGAEEMVAQVNPEDDATLFLGERWGYFRERVLLSKAL